MAAAPFFIAHNRFHSTGIDNLQNILRSLNGTGIYIPENNVKIWSAAYKIEDVPLIRGFSVLNPESAVLGHILCLYGRDGLEHAIMCRDTVKPGVMCLATDEPDKFREIDVGRTPDTALGTGQAAPYGVVRRLFQFIQRALYDLPW